MNKDGCVIDEMCYEIASLRKPFMDAYKVAVSEWIDVLEPDRKALFLKWAAKNGAWILMMGIDRVLSEHTNAHQP